MRRIVHLGLGAFHRAHQAAYTADAGGWEICGVAWRSRTVADALRESGGRCTLVERGPDGDASRTIDVITETLVAADEPDAVADRITPAPDDPLVVVTEPFALWVIEDRFANPRLGHRLAQIASGAEHEIPQRFGPPADELRAAGREPVLIDQVVAAAS